MIGFVQGTPTAESAFARKKARKRPSFLKQSTLDAVARESVAWLRDLDSSEKK